jgi:hypothetical protein
MPALPLTREASAPLAAQSKTETTSTPAAASQVDGFACNMKTIGAA